MKIFHPAALQALLSDTDDMLSVFKILIIGKFVLKMKLPSLERRSLGMFPTKEKLVHLNMWPVDAHDCYSNKWEENSNTSRLHWICVVVFKIKKML